MHFSQRYVCVGFVQAKHMQNQSCVSANITSMIEASPSRYCQPHSSLHEERIWNALFDTEPYNCSIKNYSKWF